MSEIKLTLPLPPTINHYYGYAGGSVRNKFITKHGKAFRHHVFLEVIVAGGKLKFLDARLAVDVRLHLKSKAGDIDNRIKPLFDALERATLFNNDRQIDMFHVERGEIDKEGRCVVRVWTV